MTKYTIVPHVDQSGFDIAVVADNGARQTVLDFDTEADAEAWIARDERLNGPAAPPRTSP